MGGPCTPQLRADDGGWKVQVTVLTTWIPLIFVVVTRLVLKKRPNAKFGLDDGFMILSMIPIALSSVFHLVAVHYGLGAHVACLDFNDAVKAFRFQYLAGNMNILSVWLVKVSICLFLLRMIQGTLRYFRIFTYFILAVITVMTIPVVIMWGVADIPLQATWDPNVAPNVKLGVAAIKFDYAVSAVNVVIDFFFALSPIYFLWDIRIRRSRKFTLWALLLLAIGPSVASVIKVVYLSTIVGNTEPLTHIQDDIAALVEQNAGAFVANLPCINLLFERAITAVSALYASLVSHAGGHVPLSEGATDKGRMNSSASVAGPLRGSASSSEHAHSDPEMAMSLPLESDQSELRTWYRYSP